MRITVTVCPIERILAPVFKFLVAGMNLLADILVAAGGTQISDLVRVKFAQFDDTATAGQICGISDTKVLFAGP